MKLILPENYDPVLDLRQTQEAIKYIRDTFQKEIGKVLGVSRISAPLFVPRNSGLNDNLNGFESPVSFEIKEIPGQTIEVVHSLAKWKRYALKPPKFPRDRWNRRNRADFCHFAAILGRLSSR